MKKTLLLTAFFLAAFCLTDATAQTRGRNNSGTNATQVRPATQTKQPATAVPSTATQRPATTAPRPGTTTQRPGTSTTTPPSSTQRPGTSTQPPSTGANQRPGSSATTRPGSTPNNPGNPPATSGNTASQRPGTPNTRPTTPPPGNNPPAGNRPPSAQPSHPSHPTPPPPPRPNGYRPDYYYRPPMPHTPPSYSYYRPTPPPSWRPAPNMPSFATFLGITLGSLFANTVNSLYNHGYNVTGYTSNEVYLNNVNYFNVNWPNVTLYYDKGYLMGSLFSSSSVSYDMSRYNYVYRAIAERYGMPYTVQTINNGGIMATWWGAGNTYITLSYYPEYISGLGTRYFTTLSTGN